MFFGFLTQGQSIQALQVLSSHKPHRCDAVCGFGWGLNLAEQLCRCLNLTRTAALNIALL
jgi:hypothetical protein